MSKLFSKSELTNGFKIALWSAIGAVVVTPIVAVAVAKIKAAAGVAA